MEDAMAGVSMSFVADPSLAAQMKEIARIDGISTSQAAARASAFGALVPAAARRTLRRVMEEGDDAVRQELVAQISQAIGRAGQLTVERRLLNTAIGLHGDRPESTEEELAAEAVRLVESVERKRG